MSQSNDLPANELNSTSSRSSPESHLESTASEPLKPSSKPSSKMPLDEVPEARVEQAEVASAKRWRTRIWWLTAVCALIAVGLSISSLQHPGRRITIHFRDGFGIKAGDTLRYRGIDVGDVESVELSKNLEGVAVNILLNADTSRVAVEGSQFWIQRPRLRLGQMSGLDTVLGAKYVGVIPGSQDASQRSEFTGLEAPLGLAEQDATEVRIRFPTGEGLAVGDAVRCLGISVGEVTYVELDEELEHVWIGCRLVGSAQRLARAGAQFWIERPRVDVSEVRGLETVLGGHHVAVEPSLSLGSVEQHQFIGLPEAPPLRRREGSLELELEAPSRLGLVRRAPVSYRGLEVGRVADVGLASDGASVEVQVIIEPEYADLVRDNSTWWSTGGVRFDAGLTGVELSIDSFAAWLRGGISFATPNSPGRKVATGQHFVLAERAKPEWLEWQPHIATGQDAATGQSTRPWPRAVRVAAAWESSWFGISRRRSSQSWGLPIAGRSLVLPTATIRAAASSKRPLTLEVSGKSFSIDASALPDQHGITKISLPQDVELQSWPEDSIAKAQWNGKSMLLIVNPELAEPMPLDASRVLRSAKHSMTINSDVPIPSTLEGSPVIDSSSGELHGILVRDDEQWRIVVVQ